MLLETYYEHYAENCCGRYWEMEPRHVLYMVLTKDASKRNGFKAFLESQEFDCVGWNQEYFGVLVTMEPKRVAFTPNPGS